MVRVVDQIEGKCQGESEDLKKWSKSDEKTGKLGEATGNSVPRFLLNCSLTMCVFSLGIQYFATFVNPPKYYICLMFIKTYVILTKPSEVLPSGSQ